jgi:hypothetical protein
MIRRDNKECMKKVKSSVYVEWKPMMGYIEGYDWALTGP